MSHSNSTTSNAEQANHSENRSQSHAANGEADFASLDGDLNIIFDQAQDWIKENQTLAMLGGFGLGVFIGVLMRQ